ncbi:DNA (cytosine-5-)-methyltransferase [Ramlibacter albus]|uniref:Cytosine-specific methyltransferase n=1 Tax=Ramlibacter albus TaxID=2079448 RepID=A0A923S0Z5_9BURK|nr:DNA (cytosine-5-)-methyltransferase [Ramlibacter albus]MBC5763760.1 DNA (cytosine-5-)-methyltransferase [Ramlibacter albus]
MTTPTFTFIDLFAGIGGIRQAFDQIGGECVFTSEWDPFARRTYSANYGVPEREIAGDIWEVNIADIPSHDVLVGGFPCQPFSLAGVSKKNALGRAHGFACDAQGTLFFRIAEILKAKRPHAFLLENVKNLQSHNGGHTYRVIKHVLEEELRYDLHTMVIDGKRWTPQHRERIFMVGFAKEHHVRFEWGAESWPGAGQRRLREILEPASTVSPKYTLSDKLWTYLQDYRRKHERAGNGFGYSLVGPQDTTRTLSARYHKDGSEILVDQGRSRNPRRLTPRECARLMGFPEDFQFVVSDTQLYRQFGNSVVVPAVKAVAEAMSPHLRVIVGQKKRAPGQELRLVYSNPVLKKKNDQVQKRKVRIPKVA